MKSRDLSPLAKLLRSIWHSKEKIEKSQSFWCVFSEDLVVSHRNLEDVVLFACLLGRL